MNHALKIKGLNDYVQMHALALADEIDINDIDYKMPAQSSTHEQNDQIETWARLAQGRNGFGGWFDTPRA